MTEVELINQTAAQLSCDGGGSGDYNCDPVDPWMRDDPSALLLVI